jgi:ligand-binding sensor domain-containing protein
MRYFLSLLFFLILESNSGQNVNYIHYTTNNSKLPHDIVYRLQQDKAGFLWISTDDGLIRFDGTEMENFDKGFISKYVIGTDEEHGRMWACTWKGGVHYIQNDSAILVNSFPDNFYTYNANNIIVFDDLFICYSFLPYTVLRYDSSQKLLLPYSLKQIPDSVFQVTPTEKEYYKFIKTSRHHLYAYNNLGIFEVVDKNIKPLNTAITPDYIWESPDEVLYYMKNNAIYLADAFFQRSELIYTIPFEKFKNRKPVSFRVLPSGNICVGFESADMHNGNPAYFLLNTRTGDMVDFSKTVVGEVLSADIIVDKEGTIWLSTDGRGLFHIFDFKYKQIGGDKTLENSNITCLHLLGIDSLYIGTKEGLYLYHDQKVHFIRNPKFTGNNPIGRLFSTPDGKLGASYTVLGIPSFKFSNGQATELPYYASFILKSYTLTLYPSCFNTLTNMTGKKQHARQVRVCGVSSVEEADHGRIWFSTQHGMSVYDPDAGLRRYHDLDNVLINCIGFVSGIGLWVGTNKGLYLIRDQGDILHWGIDEGLTNLNVRCFFSESRNSLWIGTQNGLFNFRNGRFTVYKRRDGLIADDALSLTRLNDKELAVGSSKGVTLFLIQSPSQEITPALNIERFTVNGKEADWLKPLNVPYNNSIYLKYRAITFIYPELVTYAYRLHEGDPWISTQNSSVVFTDLKPGDYHLELKVKKYNTDFSVPQIIEFKILTPWWGSSWFFGCLFVCSIVLIYVALKIILNRQKQKALATFELAQLRMQALQAQLNPHFISNALNTIQYFILKRDEISANHYLGQFTDLTRLFLEVSRHRFINLETELELLKNYLSLEKLRFENKFDYSIELDPAIDTTTTFIPGLMIQPFVENSINHGIVYLPKKRMGLITIRIRKSGDFINITVNDNGIGREKAKELKKRLAKSYKSHSSQILEELTQTYNLIPGCFINIETFDKENERNESQGTCVYIKVKISNSLHQISSL